MPSVTEYLKNRLDNEYGDANSLEGNLLSSNGALAYLFQPEDHGVIGNKARVFAGSAASAFGDLMTTAGAYSQKAADSLPDDDIGKMIADIAANGLLNNGQYLTNTGSEMVGNYAQNEKWENKNLWDRATNLDYWTDPNGFLTDTMVMGGSMVPTIAAAAAIPEVGAPRLIGGLLGKATQYVAPKTLSRFGFGEAPYLAMADATGMKAAQSATSKALMKADKALQSDTLASMERWALANGSTTAAMNAGDIYAELKAQGKTNDEIVDIMGNMMAEELPQDFVTGALSGLALSGKLGRVFAGKNPSRARQFAQNFGINAPINVASEYFDEANQTRLQNKYTGKDYGTLLEPTEEEAAAGAAAATPAMLFGLFGGAKNVISNKGGKNEGAKNFINSLIGRNKNNDINNTSEPSQDILTSKEYQEQQAQLNKALLQNMQQNNVPMGNTPRGNAPQGTPVTNDAVESAVAPFLGVRMDNGANGCVEAVTKIGAKMGSPFLTEQLRNGVLYVPTLVKNAGNRVIPFDASKLEAGDIIVYGDDAHVVMYDGKGGYVGNSSSQQKVVHGSDYNSMDDLEPTKIIKSDTVGGGTPVSTGGVDISNRQGGHVAQLISERTGIPADWIWAQMAHETGNFNSELAREDHNYGGIKETREGHQGVGELGYRHFDSDEEYADYAAKNLNAYTENGIKDARTIEEFAKALKDGGYYEDSLENYTNGLKNALGGDSSVKGGNMSAANAVGQMDDTAAVSLMDDFIGDVVSGGQLSQEAIAALTDTNGHFVNNAENRAVLLDDNEDLFREYLSGIAKASDAELAKRVASELAKAGDITTLEQVQQAIANGDKERLEVIANGAKMQANRLLNTIRSKKGQDSSIKISNPEIITEIINNAGSKNKNIKGFYNDFIQDRISSIDDTNEINELSSMLNVNGKFQNTPENRKSLAQRYKQEIADYYNNVYGPRHKSNIQQEPVQQAPTQPVQQPQQSQVPTVQNNIPMAQQTQEQNPQQAQVNYQAMGMRLLDFMTEHNVPHNHDNIMRALNSDNDETMAGAVRWMYRELSNSGMDIDELNNELINSNQTTPLLGGGISNETESKNSNTKTTTATEGENTTNQVQNTEPEQTEKTGEVESDNYQGYLDDKTEAQKKVIRQQLEKKTNPFGNAAGLLPMKHIMERWAETDTENKSSKEGRFYFIHGHQVKEPVYNYYNYLRDNVYNKNEEAVKENLTPPTANKTEADTNVGGKTEPQGSHFGTGTFTHTKTGKELPEAKFKNREERSDFLKCKKLAKQYAGWYSKYSKSFLFETEVGRDAFIKAADEDVFGQEVQAPVTKQETEKAPASETPRDIAIDKVDKKLYAKAYNRLQEIAKDETSTVKELESLVRAAINIYSNRQIVDARDSESLEKFGKEIINEAKKREQEKTEAPTTEETSKVEEKPTNKEPADSKRDFISEHVIVGTVPTEKANEKKTEQEENSIFGSIEDADREMFEALGISPEEMEQEEISFTNEFGDTTDEEIDALKNELLKELSKLSANPVFNPRIYSLGLQLGGKYIQKGYRTFKKWLDKMRSDFGQQIEPWAPAIWETLRTYPQGAQFDPKQAMAVSRAIGARYERGTTDLKTIQADITKSMSASTKKTIAPLIEASYNGIKKYFDMKEAENNEQRGESKGTDGGHGSVESGGSRENQSEGTGAISGRDGQEGTPVHGSNERKNSKGSATGPVREGTELEVSAGKGDNQRRDKSPLPLTEAQKHPSPTETPGHNYEIKNNATDINKKSEKVRFKQNIDAIKMLKQLEADGRMPTPSEQEVLAGYNGWGGLKGAFLDGNEMNKELREVLTDEEYEAARSTINDAFYTSPKIIRAMWEGISRMGFKGGRILEPSMGIGNFFGAMPRDIMDKSSLHGVEIDDLTSRFAKMLYPNAQIEHTGFQKAKAPDNFFDLVVSNIPFGQLTIDGYKIHNYFFANGMDKVRPGGLMVYITSQGSLAGSTDAAKMRTYLDGKADMIGAFKLPAGAFGEAGTSVSTDIVIFRKRDTNGEKSPYANNFLNVEDKRTSWGAKLYDINEYFKNHPENMLGKEGWGTDQFGKPAMRLEMEGTIDDVAKALSKAMKKLPKDIYKPVTRNDKKTFNQKETDKKVAVAETTRDYAYYMEGDKVYQNQGGEGVQITDKAKVAVLKDFIQLKHTLNALLTAERDPKATDKQLADLRKMLNKEYDAFVKKHGYLNDKAAKYFKDDPSAGFVQVLEKPIEETYTIKTKNGEQTRKKIVGVEKSDIFTKRTMQPRTEVTHVEKPDDALIASLTNKGYVDIEYMSELMGVAPEKIIGDLKGKIFKNPEDGAYVTREEYLSGNVKEKLAQAEAALSEDDSYRENVDELRKVIPADLVSSEIDVMMGAPWIPESDVQAFVDHLAGNSRYGAHIEVKFNRLAATWYVSGYGSNPRYKLDGIDLAKLIEHVLNNKPIKIYDGKGDDRVFNQQKTDAANMAADDMRREFADWIWSDKERENRLVTYYNDNFNTDVVREYDGSHLTFPGMNSNIEMKPHQKNVVWRMLQGLNTLIAHCVGAGKTFEMQAAGMEMRRLGIANKPMYCLPNNVVEQFAREFRQLYPMAKILTLQSTDLPAVQKTVKIETTEDGRRKKVDLLKGKTKAERDKILAKRADRTRMLSRIRSEDWDAIIISHTLFERFPLSPETTAAFIRQEIDLLERTILEAKGEKNLDKRALANMEEAKRKLQEQLEEALSASVDDIGISFEDLGVDQLFVDEADMFKNLGFNTKLGNIRGLSNSKSNRARDMFVKTQWLTRTLGGRGVVFATGTPISNTMAEMYIMLRYLDSAGLEKYNLDIFDNWLRTFGDIGQDIERKPTGDGFRDVTKVKKFVNMTELKKMFRKVADIKTQDELELDIPKLKNDKPTVVTLEPDPVIVNYIKNVVPERVANMGKGFKMQKGDDNMLALTNDLRKLSLNEDKIEACAERIAQKYFESTDVKGTQLVFCDMGIPKADSGKDKTENDEEKETFEIENPEVYTKLIDKLKEKGIPENEIAFIQNYNTKKKRDDVFQKVNDGKVRVLIGSTETMGAGTNCQQHLVALHDLDAPWRPRDLEQRHGRILRQGNENKEVEIFNYVVKDSFDANMWEKLKNKAAIIAQAVNNDMSIRTLEDVELNTISYAEIEEAATGNPLIKERLNVNNALIKEKNANTAFKKKVYEAEKLLDSGEKEIKNYKDIVNKIKEDIANRKETKGDKFSIILDGKEYTERAKADEALNKILDDLESRSSIEIGKIGGFALKGMSNGSTKTLQLVGKRAYPINANNMKGIEYTLHNGPEYQLSYSNGKLATFEDGVKEAEEIVKLENPHEAKVKELDDRLHEIDRQIKDSLTDKGGNQQSKNDVVTDPETGEIIESKPSSSVSVKKEDSQLEAVRKQYEDADQWMKAPNGKPTKLTEQQWLQVRTPNFKKWFGDWENDPENASKVVDENGEPMVVYHGTDNGGFDVFSIDKAGTRTGQDSAKLGAFFHEYKEYAEAFADYGRKPKSQVYEVFLNIRKPLTDVFLSTADGKKLESIKNKIEKGNHDGIIDLLGEHVVFNPNQIKSATDNSGEFSTENDNIKTSVSKNEPADQRTVEELKSDILEAVPNARNVVDTGNGITMTLPNGAKMKVEISKSLDDKVSENDKHAARLAHGLGNEVSITVNGYTLTGAKQAFIELALNGEKGTAFHEIFHVAYEMALTDAEKRAINISFGEQAKARGMSVIEYAADKYRDWRTYARKLPVGLRKEFEAIKGTIDSMRRALLGINDEYLTDEVERIFRDIESGAIWERNVKKNSENSLDNFLQNFDNEEKRYYQSKKYERKDMQRAFDEVRKGIEAVKDKIIAAKNHQKLDEIRADIDYIKNAILAFNQTSNLDDYYKDNFACDVRFALEVFENGGIVKAARNRIDKETSPEYQRGRNFRNLPAVRDGLQPTNGHRVRRNEFANSGFRLTDNINHIGANKHFIESFEKFIEAHPENYNKKLYSANEKHSDQGAFSNGENAPQSFLEKTFKSFAKNSNIKGDKIIVEQQDKDGEKEEVNLKNYIFSSPSRIAEKVGAFKYFYTIGKRAMDVLTQKRTDFERKLNKAFDLVKNEEDYKTLNDILISGDVEGKEWTKAELIADGVKENVAEAYTQIRHLMEKAYKMVNEARRRPQIHTINNASEKQIQDLRDNDFVDILNINEDDKGHKKVTYKEYANWERTYTVNKETLRKYDDDPAIQVLDIKQEGDDSFTVTVRESIPPVNKLTGYIPHFFHNYMVRIVDKDGGYVDTIDSGRTEREAVQKAEEWLKSNQLEDGQTIHISPKIADFTSLGMDEKQYAAVMGDKDYYRMMNNIAKQNDLTFQEAKEMLNGSVRQKNRHRFFGNLMQRKGVNGYEKNMGYILRHYFNSASRYYAMETEFKPKAINMYERLYGDFDKEAPNTTADYTRDYINDINGNPTTLEKAINNALMKSSIFRKFVASSFGDRAALQIANNITSATSYLCLGCLNASSALLNLTQLINTAAYLNDFEALGKGLAKGFHHKYSLGDIRVLHETNVLNDIGLDSGSGYDMNRMSAKNLLGKLNKFGMVLFKKTEAYCRCATVLAAYESARKKGKSHNQAIEYAKEINQKSNFDYSQADAPNIFRRGSILSQLLLQFKKYGIKELEVMADMLPWNNATNGKQKAIFWGLMLLACGLLQWPGEDFLDNVFFDGKLKPKMKAWMMEAAGDSPMGKALAKFAMYGLAAPVTGVDISNRAGLADVIPSKGRDLGGPSITRTVSLAADLFQGKWADAIRDVSPGLYNQYAAWIAGQSTGTRGRVNNYYDSFYDKALRAMGFKSVDESIDSDIQRITSIRKKEATEEKQRAIDNYIEDPSTENYRRLVELGVKAKTVQEERKKKKMDRLERIQSGMSKNDKKGNSGLIKFAE